MNRFALGRLASSSERSSSAVKSRSIGSMAGTCGALVRSAERIRAGSPALAPTSGYRWMPPGNRSC